MIRTSRSQASGQTLPLFAEALDYSRDRVVQGGALAVEAVNGARSDAARSLRMRSCPSVEAGQLTVISRSAAALRRNDSPRPTSVMASMTMASRPQAPLLWPPVSR